MVTVLSLGGSIVAPDTPDVAFLYKFSKTIRKWLNEDKSRQIIMVIGGGAPARIYQQAYKETSKLCNCKYSNTEADWIGITATKLNAQLVKAIFSDICSNPVVYNPTENIAFNGQVLIASGWKPGFSTDNDAVLLAEKFGAKTVLNLSNIEKVYTDDPKKNPEAKPIDQISWEDFIKIIGTEWEPGKNTPFDPIASIRAKNASIRVICAGGRNIENIENIIRNKKFVGTVIG